MKEDKVMIVRLKSGEDVIASVHEDEETDLIYLNDPMTLFFKRISSSQTVLMMSPWLPIEVIEENNAVVVNSEILTYCIPKKSLVNYYFSLISEMTTKLQTPDNVLERQMNSSFEDDPESDEDDEEEEQQVIPIKSSKLLH
jgi:hypothetical protein